MTRIRSVKPEYFSHPEVAECSIPSRLLFISLWTQADDDGRLLDQPRKIAGLAWGERDRVKTDALLTELHERGRIVRYAIDGKALIQIVHFEDHQKIPASKYRKSDLPPPPEQPHGSPSGATRQPHVTPEVEVEVEPGRGKGTGNLDIAPVEPGRDELWDALVESYGAPPTTSRFRGAWNAALLDIRQQPDAEPDELRRRVRSARAAKDTEWMAATPTALAKYWGQIGNGRQTGSAGTRAVARQLREAGQ